MKLGGSFADGLSGLKKLKRFLFDGRISSLSYLRSQVDEAGEFIEQAKLLASKSSPLEEVGDSSAPPYRRYVTARIIRDQEAIEVHVGMGHGLVIGQEDRAFPRSQLGSY